MTSILNRLGSRTVAIAAVVVLLAVTFLVLPGGSEPQKVSAYFDRTVSIYKGSELRVMGVQIGTVTAVVPEGDRVRVAMEYDDEYKLPADAKAAIITPTLTADRFVQIAPAYSGGAVLEDNAKIELEETGTPVELDQIYQSLSDLTEALGPNGANKSGALDDLLTAGTKALKGNGELGNETLLNLSAAVQTFGDNRGPLFDTVESMAQFTNTLAANDRFVDSFMGDLTSVSSQLADEQGNLRQALAALSRAVGIVQTFVRDNKTLLQKDISQLTDILGVLAKQKESLNTAAGLSALGLGNLALGWDSKSGTQGSRVQFGPTVASFDNVLCDILKASALTSPLPDGQVELGCDLFKAILKPALDQVGSNPQDFQAPQLRLGGTAPVTSLEGLLNSLKAGNP